MRAMKAHVKDGRVVLDEPTDLPEGAEVDLAVLDEDLSAEDRAELHASLDRALEDARAGRSVDALAYVQAYRERRANRPAR